MCAIRRWFINLFKKMSFRRKKVCCFSLWSSIELPANFPGHSWKTLYFFLQTMRGKLTFPDWVRNYLQILFLIWSKSKRIYKLQFPLESQKPINLWNQKLKTRNCGKYNCFLRSNSLFVEIPRGNFPELLFFKPWKTFRKTN